LLFCLFFKREKKGRKCQAKRWSKKERKRSGGGGVKHITVVTEKNNAQSNI